MSKTFIIISTVILDFHWFRGTADVGTQHSHSKQQQPRYWRGSTDQQAQRPSFLWEWRQRFWSENHFRDMRWLANSFQDVILLRAGCCWALMFTSICSVSRHSLLKNIGNHRALCQLLNLEWRNSDLESLRIIQKCDRHVILCTVKLFLHILQAFYKN